MFSKIRNVVRRIALVIFSSYGRIWDFYALTERRAMYYIYERIGDES